MKRLAMAFLAGLALPGCALGTLAGTGERIINGLPTRDFPSVGLFLSGASLCTGTLVGCQTFLTAAHCVCGSLSGAECAARPDLLAPGSKSILFQHGGWAAVESVAVDPRFAFGQRGDLAVLHLRAPVTGIAPSPLHRGAKPAFGTPALLVGFGLPESGLKRQGTTRLAACSGVPQAPFLCWDSVSPPGPPGSDASTCHGDSGGPLFIEEAGTLTLAGVTSGGDPACLQARKAFDTDVAYERDWLDAQLAGDLRAACGGLPAAGSARAQSIGAEGALNGKTSGEADYTVEVPAGTALLRVELNVSPVGAGFDLYVKREAPAGPQSFDCKGEHPGGLEFCAVTNPAPGTWHLAVRRVSGFGDFQLVATPFQLASCAASPTTLCLGDGGRFQVEASYRSRDGRSGAAHTAPLTADTGYLWFFDAGNAEALVKVLDGCAVNGHRWFFAGGLTDVRVTLTVADTRTGAVRTYTNPQGTPFAPIEDTGAFACP